MLYDIGGFAGRVAAARWGVRAEQPLVYVSLGTALHGPARHLPRCVDQLAGDFRLVLATGKVDPAMFGGVEAARTQPQLDVLAHADVFVTHAGMGGSAESLWFGVPTVAIPQAVDQFANAAMLEAIGAGARLEDLTGLRGAVDAALGAPARRASCARRSGRPAASPAPPTPSRASASLRPA